MASSSNRRIAMVPRSSHSSPSARSGAPAREDDAESLPPPRAPRIMRADTSVRWPLPLAIGAEPYDAVFLGENSLDLVAIPRGPIAWGGKTVLEALIPLPGGQAATAAAAAARLGLRTRYIGAF